MISRNFFLGFAVALCLCACAAQSASAWNSSTNMPDDWSGVTVNENINPADILQDLANWGVNPSTSDTNMIMFNSNADANTPTYVNVVYGSNDSFNYGFIPSNPTSAYDSKNDYPPAGAPSITICVVPVAGINTLFLTETEYRAMYCNFTYNWYNLNIYDHYALYLTPTANVPSLLSSYDYFDTLPSNEPEVSSNPFHPIINYEVTGMSVKIDCLKSEMLFSPNTSTADACSIFIDSTISDPDNHQHEFYTGDIGLGTITNAVDDDLNSENHLYAAARAIDDYYCDLTDCYVTYNFLAPGTYYLKATITTNDEIPLTSVVIVPIVIDGSTYNGDSSLGIEDGDDIELAESCSWNAEYGLNNIAYCLNAIALTAESLVLPKPKFSNNYNMSSKCHTLSVVGDWLFLPNQVICPMFPPYIKDVITPFITLFIGLMGLKLLTKREQD